MFLVENSTVDVSSKFFDLVHRALDIVTLQDLILDQCHLSNFLTLVHFLTAENGSPFPSSHTSKTLHTLSCFFSFSSWQVSG